jgi:phenylalanyl-tRNA synthetase beta chain
MKLSLNWLKDFVNLPENISAQELSDKLTLHTAEVEGVESNYENYKNIVVGEIKEITPHPDADKLRVTQTDVGGETIQIVCGGSNIYEGMKCIVAKLGARVFWHGDMDKEMIMAPVKLRGVESLGMICSADEVLMGDLFKHAEKEVVDLKDQKNLKVGDNIANVLGEERIILDIDNKSLTHRPDLWGHFGMAREFATIFKTDLRDLKLDKVEYGKEKLSVNVEAKDRCPRFMLAKISGLKIEESPDWIKKNLEDAGVRPISNIVDVTNYVMLELGQPMHAYDADKISGEFSVRMANDKEKFTTLDGVERELTKDEVLVCDSEKVLGLGGVMGGQESEVSDQTTTIYLESANWTKAEIRKTGARLGLRTEAVQRYEKGLDPIDLPQKAMTRALTLLKELCPSIKVETELCDVKNFKEEKNEIKLSVERTKSIIGLPVEEKEMLDILERLGFQVKAAKDELTVLVPNFRSTGDVYMEDDLVEEIARMVGYDNIEGKGLLLDTAYSSRTKMNILERKLRNFLVANGLSEIMNYSFVSSDLMKKLDQDTDGLIKVKKAFSSDLEYLRDSLIPRVLDVASKNNEKNELKLFEIGHVHFKNKRAEYGLPLEDINLAILVARKKAKKSSRDIFFTIKGLVEALLEEFGLNVDFELSKEAISYLQTSADCLNKKKKIASIGTVNSKTLVEFGLDSRELAIFEISLKKLLQLSKDKIDYKPLPKYPAVINGMSLIVPEEITIKSIKNKILNVKQDLIQDIDVIDIYRGKQIESGNKSVVLDITYMDLNKTLEESEVQKIHKSILEELKSLGISHR